MNTRLRLSMRALAAGGLILGLAAAALLAGPLNPPAGPVTPGGKTTQEIYDALTASSAATGAIGARGPAVPGADRSVASITTTDTPGINGPLLGLRTSFTAPFTFAGGSSLPQQGPITIVRELGGGSGAAFRGLTLRGPFSAMSITVPSAGGNTLYTLQSVMVVGLRHYHIERANGTRASIEEVDLIARTVTVTDPSGQSAAWNFQTGSAPF